MTRARRHPLALRRAGRMASCLLLAALASGCVALPTERPPPPQPPEPASGTVPQLPSDLPRIPPEAEAEPRLAPQPAPQPRLELPSYHPAGEALVEQARREALLGSPALAGATLERALRIDGSNPWIWIELGHLRLEAGQAAAADSMARKALSLASMDPSARAAAGRLLQQAGAGP